MFVQVGSVIELSPILWNVKNVMWEKSVNSITGHTRDKIIAYLGASLSNPLYLVFASLIYKTFYFLFKFLLLGRLAIKGLKRAQMFYLGLNLPTFQDTDAFSAYNCIDKETESAKSFCLHQRVALSVAWFSFNNFLFCLQN